MAYLQRGPGFCSRFWICCSCCSAAAAAAAVVVVVVVARQVEPRDARLQKLVTSSSGFGLIV